ncbi:alpha/beta fold hydrolase [Thermotoga sp. SG1]|uniref:alpha/beta fold hydrolase n=1 Tax=Thermotoga sp. SG1 TaxID=126739 RepID=UPI000C761FD6|nr:alpha/beta fold hydrolase [Thermotoga sp. SG1]PLV57397.1 dipeptidyl aminopeptidase [Thermotoga sp. SG1]
MRFTIFFLVLLGVMVFGAFEQEAYLFVQRLTTEDFETALSMCTDQMRKQLSLQNLSSIWYSLKSQLGDFKEIIAYEKTTQGEYEIYNFTLRFEKGEISALVTMDKEGKVAGLFFTQSAGAEYEPPDYANLESFEEKDISVNGLPGKLTIPEGKGPFPAVVLVHGSGPNDMDETIGPNKIFKDIAYGLSSNGIIVLRYHKRTFVEKMDPATLTVEEEVIKDAQEAVKILKQREDVSTVYVLGHSLGAMLSPEIAERSKADGVIMLAPPARPLEDLMEDQLKYLQSLGLAENIEEILKTLEKLRKKELPPDEIVLGAPAKYFYDLRERQPVLTAKRLSIPMLLIFGGRDYQVSEKDRKIWLRELSDKENVKIVVFEDLNHLMMTGEGKSTPVEYMKKGHVDRRVIDAIVEWMVK